MKIRMLHDRQGWFWPVALYAGQEHDLPEDVATYLIEMGAAEAVALPDDVTPAPEKPSARRRKAV